MYIVIVIYWNNTEQFLNSSHFLFTLSQAPHLLFQFIIMCTEIYSALLFQQEIHFPILQSISRLNVCELLAGKQTTRSNGFKPKKIVSMTCSLLELWQNFKPHPNIFGRVGLEFNHIASCHYVTIHKICTIRKELFELASLTIREYNIILLLNIRLPQL